MTRRKTAQQVPKKIEPESRRRYLVINSETGNPTLGSFNLYRDGITSKEKAERISRSLLIETEVVLAHEFFGHPDPDLEGEE